MGKRSTEQMDRVVGLDLGDRWASECVLSKDKGEVVRRGRVAMTRKALRRRYPSGERLRIVVEVGAQSPWVSRVLEALGHEVIVANAREVQLIWGSGRKGDTTDAEALARLGRVDPALLRPIEHRSEATQCDLAVLRSRDALVRSRTLLINAARGISKALGHRLPSCSAECFAQRMVEQIPQELSAALAPMLETIARLTEQIRSYERWMGGRIEQVYPEAECLQQVKGVGPVTSLAFVLTLERPERFAKSREVGPFLGLVPRRSQSGRSDPQLRITKRGDAYVRRLLVGSAQYILGPFGPDSDLRRYGLRIAERGGKNAKKRAVVAVARKLAVLLHHLWITGEVYELLYQTDRAAVRAAA